MAGKVGEKSAMARQFSKNMFFFRQKYNIDIWSQFIYALYEGLTLKFLELF